MTDNRMDAFDPERLDGYTIEDLSEYLDRGKTPRDPVIEASPGCQIALAALERLQKTSLAVLDEESTQEPERDEAWVNRLLGNITREARAGRDIPVRSDRPDTVLLVSEGAVRGLIRAAGDAIDGVIIGRCTFSGDVAKEAEPVTVDVTASIMYGWDLVATAARIRAAVFAALAEHTDLDVVAVNVTVEDLHAQRVMASRGSDER